MARLLMLGSLGSLAALSLLGCGRSTPPEPTSSSNDTAQTATIPSAAPQPSSTNAAAATNAVSTTSSLSDNASAASSATSGSGEVSTPKGTIVKHGGPDPLDGKFSIADATKDLKGSGGLMATIDTSMGAFSCKLYDDKAPNTVANFVGRARGLRPWKYHEDWVKRAAYDGTKFHRIIKGFMIQGGDPLGNGSGEPGYTIKDELWPGAKHDKPGLLCMANRGHDTNGQQFFITDAAAAHLDGNYTIFGECAPEKLVHDIAGVPVAGSNPITPVVIKTVTIAREKPGK